MTKENNSFLDVIVRILQSIGCTPQQLPLVEPDITVESVSTMKRYVPKKVWDCLIAGDTEPFETYTRKSIVFVGINDSDVPAEEGRAKAQSLLTAVQPIVNFQGGSVHDVCFDGKGVMLMIVFGSEDSALGAMLGSLQAGVLLFLFLVQL